MASPRRVNRVAEQIRELVATELYRLADPRFGLVTISSVVVSQDLRNAKIYWMASGDKDRLAEIKAAFESANGVLRRAVAGSLGTKFAPELKFFYDDTLDESLRVEQLLARIKTAV